MIETTLQPSAPVCIPPSRDLLLAAARTLADLAVDAEILGAELCADPEIVLRHSARLQQIDRLSQSLAHISDVLGANDPEAAVERISLSALRIELEYRQI